MVTPILQYDLGHWPALDRLNQHISGQNTHVLQIEPWFDGVEARGYARVRCSQPSDMDAHYRMFMYGNTQTDDGYNNLLLVGPGSTSRLGRVFAVRWVRFASSPNYA